MQSFGNLISFYLHTPRFFAFLNLYSSAPNNQHDATGGSLLDFAQLPPPLYNFFSYRIQVLKTLDVENQSDRNRICNRNAGWLLCQKKTLAMHWYMWKTSLFLTIQRLRCVIFVHSKDFGLQWKRAGVLFAFYLRNPNFSMSTIILIIVSCVDVIDVKKKKKSGKTCRKKSLSSPQMM